MVTTAPPPAPAVPTAARRSLWLVTALTAVAPVTWGTTYVVTTEWLPPDRPLLAATVRALPAGLLLVAAGRVLPRGAWWWKAAVLGTLNIGAFFALLFVAAYRLPGGVAAVLGAVQPLVVALLALPLLGQPLRARTFVLGATGVAGVALVVLTDAARLDALGVLAGLVGTVCMGAGVVLTKRWGRPVPVLAFTGWQLAAGGLLLLPVALAVEGLPPALTAGHVGGFLYLAVVNTALAYVLWLRGIGLLPADRVSFLALLSPVVAAAAGWVLLGQSLGPLQLAGVVLALGSVVLAQRGR
ncbi:probable blue pigment (indigoidine) exporter [Geodermatophilus obscurus]|uniref:Probable blue pigment (Indigoidine) exporter n=1 Tax=Geodermatophilus obscurus TaxID=1861 RepID=A0A1I5C5V6_9ACTN|nr:EamA family transporter [Geodermatophilus obscurus]SFN82385.1 probable blue pigment (indigoidine) exporter [Geodermatophilus obscurus]